VECFYAVKEEAEATAKPSSEKHVLTEEESKSPKEE